jgi:hypothetical protein
MSITDANQDSTAHGAPDGMSPGWTARFTDSGVLLHTRGTN